MRKHASQNAARVKIPQKHATVFDFICNNKKALKMPA